jgi:pimeloyl-CoA synthetase
MASLFQVELPPDIEKARETVSAVADNVIRNAAGDAALMAIQDTAEKTKAVVDAIITSVETDVQAIADEGIQKLYESLGLNEEVINFARSIVQMAMHGADLAGSAVLKGMNIINSMDMNALPMSAVAAGLSVAQTFAD